MNRKYHNHFTYFTNIAYKNTNNFFLIPNYNKTSAGIWMYLNKFWADVMLPLPKGQVVSVLFRVAVKDLGYRTMCNIIKIDNTEEYKDKFFRFLNQKLVFIVKTMKKWKLWN